MPKHWQISQQPTSVGNIIAQQNDTFEYFKQQANEYRQKYSELLEENYKLQNEHKMQIKILTDDQEKQFRRRVECLDQASQHKFTNQELILKERDAEVCRLVGEQQLLQDRIKKLERELYQSRQDIIFSEQKNDKLQNELRA